MKKMFWQQQDSYSKPQDLSSCQALIEAITENDSIILPAWSDCVAECLNTFSEDCIDDLYDQLSGYFMWLLSLAKGRDKFYWFENIDSKWIQENIPSTDQPGKQLITRHITSRLHEMKTVILPLFSTEEIEKMFDKKYLVSMLKVLYQSIKEQNELHTWDIENLQTIKDDLLDLDPDFDNKEYPIPTVVDEQESGVVSALLKVDETPTAPSNGMR